MTRVVGVEGTCGWRAGWIKPDSSLWVYLAQFCISPALVGGQHFRWNSGLGRSLNPFLPASSRTAQWSYGGTALGGWMDGLLDKGERVVIAHSHGGQVALHAAAQGFWIDRLLTVATPAEREDMKDVIAAALQHIGQWLHVYPLEHDGIAWLGGTILGDGKLGAQRVFDLSPEKGRNIGIAGIGHSGLLEDIALRPLWKSEGLVEFLKGGTA